MSKCEIYSPDGIAVEVERFLQDQGLQIVSDYSDYGCGTYFEVRCTVEQFNDLDLPPGCFLVSVREPTRADANKKGERHV